MFIEENIIIEELVLGKQDAFKELVHYYKDIVYNTSLSFLKNETDAEDITQEVFIEIFNSIPKIDECIFELYHWDKQQNESMV